MLDIQVPDPPKIVQGFVGNLGAPTHIQIPNPTQVFERHVGDPTTPFDVQIPNIAPVLVEVSESLVGQIRTSGQIEVADKTEMAERTVGDLGAVRHIECVKIFEVFERIASYVLTPTDVQSTNRTKENECSFGESTEPYL